MSVIDSFYLWFCSPLDLLQKSPDSRVVNVSSIMHRWGRTDFEIAAVTSSTTSYSSSKLAQVFFSYEFNRRYLASGVCAIAVRSQLK